MTTIVTKSGARKEIPENLELTRVVGLDEEGRIVVDDFDAFNSKPEWRGPYGDGRKYLHRPFLFGLTLCCNASDKGMEDGVGCRGCYGLEGDLAESRDGRKVIADAGAYLYQADDGTFPELDALDHFENITEGAHA